MYHKHHTKGIVLASLIESADSRRLLLLTSDLGLVLAQVKSARVAASKLKAGIQDYSYGEYSLLQGKMGWRLVSVRANGNFFETNKKSKIKTLIISRILNLVRILVAGEEPNSRMFEILDQFLRYIENVEQSEEETIEVLVVARLLYELGYLRHVEWLEEVMSRVEIKGEDIVLLNTNKLELVKYINEALAAAGIKS